MAAGESYQKLSINRVAQRYDYLFFYLPVHSKLLIPSRMMIRCLFQLII